MSPPVKKKLYLKYFLKKKNDTKIAHTHKTTNNPTIQTKCVQIISTNILILNWERKKKKEKRTEYSKHSKAKWLWLVRNESISELNVFRFLNSCYNRIRSPEFFKNHLYNKFELLACSCCFYDYARVNELPNMELHETHRFCCYTLFEMHKSTLLDVSVFGQ